MSILSRRLTIACAFVAVVPAVSQAQTPADDAALASALRAAGCEPADTVKLTYYVTDIQAYRDSRAAIGAAYREHFRSDYPASTLVEVSSLVDPNALIEIDAVAVRPA